MEFNMLYVGYLHWVTHYTHGVPYYWTFVGKVLYNYTLSCTVWLFPIIYSQTAIRKEPPGVSPSPPLTPRLKFITSQSKETNKHMVHVFFYDFSLSGQAKATWWEHKYTRWGCHFPLGEELWISTYPSYGRIQKIIRASGLWLFNDHASYFYT